MIINNILNNCTSYFNIVRGVQQAQKEIFFRTRASNKKCEHKRLRHILYTLFDFILFASKMTIYIVSDSTYLH